MKRFVWLTLHLCALAALAWTPAALAEDAREAAARDGANLQRPVWSPDGTKLSFEANFHEKKTIELHVGDPWSKSFTRIVPVSRGSSAITSGFTKTRNLNQVVHEISWAPRSAGTYVYSASGSASDFDLYLNSGSVLAQGAGSDGGPSFSPSGQQLAFTSARSGEGDLYLIDFGAASQAPGRLTRQSNSSEVYASWSPDGEQIAYVAHGKRGDNLWLTNKDGQAKQLTFWKGSQTHPVFSPDGKHIAFYANHQDEDRFDLYVMAVGSSQVPTLLIRSVVLNARGPVWSPDSKRLLFAHNDDERFDPLAQVQITSPGKLQRLSFGTVGHGDLDLIERADGSWWLAYIAQGRTGDKERTFKRLFVVKVR